MSIEYKASVSLTAEHLSSVRGTLAANGKYVILGCSLPNRICVRMAEYPHKEDGAEIAEDIEIAQNGELIISFRSVNRRDRENFIRLIVSTLADYGIESNFEEI